MFFLSKYWNPKTWRPYRIAGLLPYNQKLPFFSPMSEAEIIVSWLSLAQWIEPMRWLIHSTSYLKSATKETKMVISGFMVTAQQYGIIRFVFKKSDLQFKYTKIVDKQSKKVIFKWSIISSIQVVNITIICRWIIAEVGPNLFNFSWQFKLY